MSVTSIGRRVPAQIAKPPGVLSDPELGTLLLILTELMFFFGLISAYLVLREQAPVWPPPGQPRHPAGLTAFSTGLLLASWGLLRHGARAIKAGDSHAGRTGWRWAQLTGFGFLLLQGVEWSLLIDYGRQTGAHLYEGIFYTLVVAHAAHVLAGLLALAWGNFKLTASDSELSPEASSAIRMFWTFVVGIWPPLYLLLYIW